MNVLIDADTIRSPELRHEVPAAILDPFLYGERDGVAFAATSALDAANIAKARPELRQLDTMSELGLRELIVGGMVDGALLGLLCYFPIRYSLNAYKSKRKDKRKLIRARLEA